MRIAVTIVGALAAFAFVVHGAAAAAESKPILVHSEDFSTAGAFDAGFWFAETGLFRNHEAQSYQPGNIAVRGGALVLEGRKQTVPNAAFDPNGADWLTTTRESNYTSGSLLSREAFTSGIFEVTARLPQSRGAWPAIWTIWEQGTPYREIDMVEAVGVTPGVAFSTVYAGHDLTSLRHWSTQTDVPDIGSGFHLYRLEWRKDRILIAIDGKTVLKVDPEEAHKNGIDPLHASMRLRLNLALGGSWGGAIDDAALPARMEIRSIKIWQFAP